MSKTNGLRSMDLKERYELIKETLSNKDFNPLAMKNIFTCDNGHDTFTIDADNGLTPDKILCPVCGKPSYSHNYNLTEVELKEFCNTHVWYRPSLEEAIELETDTLYKVLNGHLLLKNIAFVNVPGVGQVPAMWWKNADGTKSLKPYPGSVTPFISCGIGGDNLTEEERSAIVNNSNLNFSNTGNQTLVVVGELTIKCRNLRKLVVNGTNIGNLFDLVLEGERPMDIHRIIKNCFNEQNLR